MVSSSGVNEVTGVGLSRLAETARKLLDLSGETKIWLFDGEMGAGKTTLIKEILRQLGVKENVSSPTFAIINEYRGGAQSFYHFDFYRVKNLAEAQDIGVEEYFYSGNYCFVEWPEVIMPLVPANYLQISIEAGEGEERNYKLTQYGIN